MMIHQPSCSTHWCIASAYTLHCIQVISIGILKVVEAGSRPYLLYTESGSKNHTGGLNQRKVTNKVVKAFANVQNRDRGIVRLYTKYMELWPDDAPSSAFYLQPLKCPHPNCWYQSKLVGHNQLS